MSHCYHGSLECLHEPFAKVLEDRWHGAHQVCLILLACIHCWNSLVTNWGPLSDTNWWGNPACANTWRSTAIVLEVEVEPMAKAPGHLKWASTMKKYILPWNRPAKSTCTLCQGLVGQVHRCHCWWISDALTGRATLDNFFNGLVQAWPPNKTAWETLHLGHPSVVLMQFVKDSAMQLHGIMINLDAPQDAVLLHSQFILPTQIRLHTLWDIERPSMAGVL